MTPRPSRTVLLSALVAVLLLPTLASASPTMTLGIADENVLNGDTPGGTDATVAAWKAAGVQDVRVFAQWDKLAPSPDATKMPADFDESHSSSYDFGALDRKLDAVVKHGLSVTLVISGPGPVWGSLEPARRNGSFKPSPTRFKPFAAAVAQHVASRVDRYIVWNEPNVGTWLKPQYLCTGTHCTSYAPHLYRKLARAGYSAIHAQDPGARVAVGGTSSKGSSLDRRTNGTTQPLTFLREMACVTDRYKTKRSGLCRNFRPVTGEALSYHPHSVNLSPATPDPAKNNARMADLPRLTKVLDKLGAHKRLKVKGAKRMPLWLDEYGYETNPPDKQNGAVSPKTAATWLQWGWSVAARNPRVQLLTQYEWFDEPMREDPDLRFNRWQSGLFTVTGKAKPLSKVFDRPIFGWRTGKAGHVWGQVRPGEGKVSVQLQQKSGSGFRTYKTITTNRNGIFLTRVPRSATARYRFAFRDPVTGAAVVSATTTLRKIKD